MEELTWNEIADKVLFILETIAASPVSLNSDLCLELGFGTEDYACLVQDIWEYLLPDVDMEDEDYALFHDAERARDVVQTTLWLREKYRVEENLSLAAGVDDFYPRWEED